MTTNRFKVKIEDKTDVERFKCFLSTVYDKGDFSVEVEVFDDCERFVGSRYLRRCNIFRDKMCQMIDSLIFVDMKDIEDGKYDVYMDYRLNQ